MSQSVIVERIVVSYQLRSGMSPTEVLVRHYDGLCGNIEASESGFKYREARDIVSRIDPQFFMEIARSVGVSLESVIDLFKDSRVVKFFQKIGWKIEKFWKILREGYSAVKIFSGVISDYVSESKVLRWTREEIFRLDAWLDRPENKRKKVLLGSLMGVMFVYVWFVQADTGDIGFDWDMSDAVDAMSGSYSLSSILMGPDGVQLVALMAMGMAGFSFPWPGATSVHFIGAVITTLAKEVRKRLKPSRKPIEQEAQELGMA